MAKKIKLDSNLYSRAQKAAKKEGYSSLEEFIISIIEKELSELETAAEDQGAINDQLRGLGYIE